MNKKKMETLDQEIKDAILDNAIAKRDDLQFNHQEYSKHYNAVKIRPTEIPLLHQMDKMSSCLRNKFDTSAYVEIKCWHMAHLEKSHFSYYLYVEDTYNDHFDTWPELVIFYNRVMGDEV